MRIRTWVLASAAAAAFAYVAYPYVTLARLGAALGSGDAQTLERLVAWGPVREGIKEDICDDVADMPASSGNSLRPFGYSFVRGVAANVIDTRVSPRGLLAVAQRFDPATLTLDAVSGVRWAFFDGSPTAFVAELRPPGDGARGEPVRVQMELQGLSWKVTRVWLPHKLLMAANDPS
ncbi:MAG: DUF2939 domain-containing protein [Proteobacteria bacterium]|nr:DUF2939 domain-containing protein [Pseudomonadota bacterium]